jgi:hypothetical protein
MEAMQRRQRAAWSDPEDRPTAIGARGAIPAINSCAVEVPVDSLNQRCGFAAVRATALLAKVVKRRQRATRAEFEDCAVTGGPAIGRCSVEISISGRDQTRVRADAVRATALLAKVVKRRQRAARREFEDCAVIGGPAGWRRSVEVAVDILDHPARGKGSVKAVFPYEVAAETVQGCKRAARGDLEDGGTVTVPYSVCCPIEVPVGTLNQPGVRVGTVRAIAGTLRAKVVQRRQAARQYDLKIVPQPNPLRRPLQ